MTSMSSTPPHPTDPDANPSPSVRAQWLAVEYDDGPAKSLVFSDISLSATGGHLLAVCGPSGSGKSSLLRILGGLQTPTRGAVDIVGRAFIVYQEARLIPFLSVAENLALAADLASAPVDRDRIANILDDLGLGGFAHRMPSTLSGGEAHRVAVGRALAAGASILLVDEPTASLDRIAAQQIGGVLLGLARTRNAVVIVATHDEQLTARADSVLRLASQSEILAELAGNFAP